MFFFSDTDSFVYNVKTDCIYTDMKTDLTRFDTSGYPDDNVFEMPCINKKIPGLFKDELDGQLMTEFVGLRSKMYSFKGGPIEKKTMKVKSMDKVRKAKGIKKYVLEKKIKFEDFIDCIQKNCAISKQQNSIRSKLHTVFTIRQDKIALSPFDNKRVVMSNNIDTLPWGHYKLNEIQ